jgi:hypothetical protein
MTDSVDSENRYAEYYAPHLRDLLPAIFQHLLADDPDSLRSALCVCRGWAAAGIPLLWHKASVHQLLRIEDTARRQMYADEIQDFAVGRFAPRPADSYLKGNGLLEALRYPRLRCLNVFWEAGLLDAHGIVPFLQPRLEVLRCCGRHLINADVQQQLAAKCSHLRELRLFDLHCRLTTSSRAPISVEGTKIIRGRLRSLPGPADEAGPVQAAEDDCSRLGAVVGRLPTLNLLALRPSFGGCGGEAFVPIAAHANLKALHDVYLDTATLRTIVRRVARPFPALRELHADVESGAMSVLVAAVREVEELKLAFSTRDGSQPLPPPPPALGEVASLHQLRSLRLMLSDSVVFTRADAAAALGQLPRQLRVLSIQCDVGHVRINGFSDGDFASFVARLPRLTALTFDVTGQLTAAAFRLAGEACLELEELALVCKCYLSALEGSRVKPLFPRLKVLESHEPQAHRWYWHPSDWM